MRKFSTAILFIITVSALAWFLPWLYSMAFPAGSSDPFLAYSPISDQWIITQKKDIGPGVSYFDEKGNELNISTRDMMLPQLYYKDLIARGTMPDTIKGFPIDLPILRHAEMTLTSSPHDVNKVQPEVYLIMESMPSRVDLSDPKELFRADGKIEFVNLSDNSVNSKKSRLFTETFDARGFKYPVKWASAQITARKPYDEGYLLIDNDGALYHFKQQVGRPYLAKINTGDIKARYAYILENMNRTELGFIVSEDNDLYLLTKDGGYNLVPVPVGKVYPDKERIVVMGNLFNRVFRFSGPEQTRWYAVDRSTNNLLSEKIYPVEISTAEKIGAYIFPFTLSFTSVTDSYGKPRIEDLSLYALPLNIILAILLCAMFYKRNRKCAIGGAAVTLFFGIYSFVAFYILKK